MSDSSDHLMRGALLRFYLRWTGRDEATIDDVIACLASAGGSEGASLGGMVKPPCSQDGIKPMTIAAQSDDGITPRKALLELAASFAYSAMVPKEFYPNYRDANGKPLYLIAAACEAYILRYCDERFPERP